MSLTIYFGPYEAHGIITHKTQKLYGVLTQLNKMNYQIELVPVRRLNALIFYLRGKEIYRCDIRYLMFNMDFEDDPVAQNIVKSIEESRTSFDDDQNMPNFGPVHSFEVEDVSLMYEIPEESTEFENKFRRKRVSIDSI